MDRSAFSSAETSENIPEQMPAKLAPDMASIRLIVLRFIRNYVDRWGQSPSQFEIAHGCSITRSGVRNALRSLEADGRILRTAGPRGIALPSERDAAVRKLRALGWCVDEDCRSAVPAPARQHSALLPPAALTYRPCRDSSQDTANDDSEGAREASAGRS